MKKIGILSMVCVAFLATAAVALAHGPRPGGPHGPGLLGHKGPRPQLSQAFRDCMTAQGITRPATHPTGPPSEAHKAKLEAAFQACKQHLPAAAVAAHDALVTFRQCLQSKNLPAPPARGTRPSAEDRARVKAVLEACRALLPPRP